MFGSHNTLGEIPHAKRRLCDKLLFLHVSDQNIMLIVEPVYNVPLCFAQCSGEPGVIIKDQFLSSVTRVGTVLALRRSFVQVAPLI